MRAARRAASSVPDRAAREDVQVGAAARLEGGQGGGDQESGRCGGTRIEPHVARGRRASAASRAASAAQKTWVTASVCSAVGEHEPVAEEAAERSRVPLGGRAGGVEDGRDTECPRGRHSCSSRARRWSSYSARALSAGVAPGTTTPARPRSTGSSRGGAAAPPGARP